MIHYKNKQEDLDNLQPIVKALLDASETIPSGDPTKFEGALNRKESSTVGASRAAIEKRGDVKKHYEGGGYTVDRRSKVKHVTMEMAQTIDFGCAQFVRNVCRPGMWGEFKAPLDTLIVNPEDDEMIMKDVVQMYEEQKTNAIIAT